MNVHAGTHARAGPSGGAPLARAAAPCTSPRRPAAAAAAARRSARRSRAASAQACRLQPHGRNATGLWQSHQASGTSSAELSAVGPDLVGGAGLRQQQLCDADKRGVDVLLLDVRARAGAVGGLRGRAAVSRCALASRLARRGRLGLRESYVSGMGRTAGCRRSPGQTMVAIKSPDRQTAWLKYRR